MIRKFVLAAAAFVAAGAFATLGSSEAEAKPKWKHKHHGYHHGGPPPWAPAHGYRRKHERSYSYRRSYDGPRGYYAPRWRY